MKKLSFLSLLFSFSLTAQDQPAMADLMRSNGKIYVVVAVLVLIFLGIAAFLFYIERKVDRLDP